MAFKVVRQHDIKDCGAACLSMICRFYNLKIPMAKLRELIKVDDNGTNLYGLVDGAMKLGFDAAALQGDAKDFIDSFRNKAFTLPIIARIIIDGALEHYVVIYKISKEYVYIADPGDGKKRICLTDFFDIWTGHIVTFSKTETFIERNECKGTFIRFLKLVVSQKKLLMIVLLVSIVIALIGVLGAFIFQIIIDGVVNQQNNIVNGITLGQVCSGIIILYLFQMVMNVVRGYFLSVISKNVDLSLTLNYYNHIVDLSTQQMSGRKTGELMSRFNDAANITEAISSATLSIVLDTLMVGICVFILYTLNSLLFFITLVTVLAYAIVVICFLNPIKNVNEKLMEKNAEITSYLKESIDGIETVKAFGVEKSVKRKAEKGFVDYIDKSMKSSIIYTIQDSLSGAVASIGVIILLWIGTNLVMNDIISLGILMTFYSLLGYFLDPIQNLINLQTDIQTAIVAADRLNDILDLNIEEEKITSIDLDSDIEIKNISFRYGNRKQVIKNINMNIKQGETVALIGESGSGKTTLAKLIMAYYPVENGEIIIGGKNISELNSRNVRDNIAYISQDVFLFSDSIKNNLTLGNEAVSMEEIRKACELSLACEFIDELPFGYETMLGENGHDLSGGQKQRLAIARALLKKPKILIMDEATSHLDTVTEKFIKETINNLSEDITCIIIAHRISTIRNCDNIYVMDKGEIIESGKHEELMSKNGVYKKFYMETV